MTTIYSVFIMPLKVVAQVSREPANPVVFPYGVAAPVYDPPKM